MHTQVWVCLSWSVSSQLRQLPLSSSTECHCGHCCSYSVYVGTFSHMASILQPHQALRRGFMSVVGLRLGSWGGWFAGRCVPPCSSLRCHPVVAQASQHRLSRLGPRGDALSHRNQTYRYGVGVHHRGPHAHLGAKGTPSNTSAQLVSGPPCSSSLFL